MNIQNNIYIYITNKKEHSKKKLVLYIRWKESANPIPGAK